MIKVFVYFEKENINTGDMESELLLTIFSSLAESESVSIAENESWAIQKRFQNGTFKIGYPPYGYKNVSGKMVIDEAEAEIVRFIFAECLSGKGSYKIAKALREKKALTKRGGKWSSTVVKEILKKENYRVYTILGDGEIEEGQVWEAAMFAGNHHLDNLTAFVDYNGLQIDGTIDEVNSAYPIAEKFAAFKWNTIEIDGHDFDAIKKAVDDAKACKGMPTAVIMKTVKGKGVSYMENAVNWHGAAPNEELYNKAMDELKSALAELEA